MQPQRPLVTVLRQAMEPSALATETAAAHRSDVLQSAGRLKHDDSKNIYSYSDALRGADRPTSAGDDGSIRGFLTGMATGNFPDYARGSARLSYADRPVPGDAPALRTNRAAVFVKQGPNPYIVAADDIRKGDGTHDYHWQWYTKAREAGRRNSAFRV